MRENCIQKLELCNDRLEEINNIFPIMIEPSDILVLSITFGTEF